MPKFTKKPVTIEARRCDNSTTPCEIAAWCDGRACGVGDLSAKQWIEVKTLNGPVRVDFGEWIVKGVSGEFYPCADDIFRATYTNVDGTEITE